MDKIDKSLLKIPLKQRRALLKAAQKINQGDLEGLDFKKLRGSKDIFRVRVGSYRIILKITAKEKPIVIAIERRNEKTYKNL